MPSTLVASRSRLDRSMYGSTVRDGARKRPDRIERDGCVAGVDGFPAVEPQRAEGWNNSRPGLLQFGVHLTALALEQFEPVSDCLSPRSEARGSALFSLSPFGGNAQCLLVTGQKGGKAHRVHDVDDPDC